MSVWMIRLFSLACGLAVANLYYAQPLLGLMAQSFAVDPAQTGLVVTCTQLGYALGLVVLVPLGDRLENRSLIVSVMLGSVLALLAMAASTQIVVFAVASILVGVSSVVAQILIPLAAHFTPEESRGQVVGKVMSGLLLGILLARAAAGFLSDSIGWRGVYFLSASLMLAMAVLLRVCLPRRQPTSNLSYGQLLSSLKNIYLEEPLLRRRAFYQFLMFGSFSLFWTGITFLLSAAPFFASQTQIGLFALVGALGALVAPWVGQQGDRGRARPLTGASFALAIVGFSLTALPIPNLLGRSLVLVLGAILLDVAVQATLILGQQQIYSLRPEQRSRLNTLYIATFFLGGAAGSGLSGWLFSLGGWTLLSAAGGLLPLVGWLAWRTEKPV